MTNKTARDVSTALVENWVIPNGIPKYLLSNNGPQFVAKLVAAVILFICIKH